MQQIYSALINVFTPDGAPDETGIRRVVDYNLDHCRVDGLYVNGSTGENISMPLEKRRQVLRIAAEAAAGRCPLIAQIGSNAMEEMLELADEAAKNGYQMVSAVTPYYYKHDFSEIKTYYATLAKYSELPVLPYYIPSLTGVTMPPAQLLELLSIENICGIKFTAMDFYLMERVRHYRPGIRLFSGFDEALFPACMLQVDGAIGSTYNVIGHWAKALVAAVDRGEFAAALDIQHDINAVIEQMLSLGVIPSIKALLHAGDCLPPMRGRSPDDPAVQALKTTIDRLDHKYQ